jgi:hypothetical protein
VPGIQLLKPEQVEVPSEKSVSLCVVSDTDADEVALPSALDIGDDPELEPSGDLAEELAEVVPSSNLDEDAEAAELLTVGASDDLVHAREEPSCVQSIAVAEQNMSIAAMMKSSEKSILKSRR